METNSPDGLLRQYAECDEPERSEALLEALVVNHAQPGIRRIVRHKLAFQGALEAQDAEDVASEVLLELIGRLRAMKEGSAAPAIGAFSGYTAVAAYHACNEYLRRKYPNRHRLKTQLRYLLNTDKRFGIWERADGRGTEWTCGFAKWQAGALPAATQDSLNRWRDTLSDIPRGRSSLHPAELLTRIFERFGAPLEFDELVGMVGQIWGVDDPAPVPDTEASRLESGDADPAERMALRQWMQQLWEQIRDLPEGQRAALLLNLRCGTSGSAAALIPLTGIASVREVAAALGYQAEEFAAVWNRLPLDDLAIAERLGVTRQKVINLRKSARERLLRRMSGQYRFT